MEKDLEVFHNLSVLTFLHDLEYFVSVVNMLAMKKYAKGNSIRGVQTDRLSNGDGVFCGFCTMPRA